MAKAFAKQFYNSKAWQSCKNSYITSVSGLCETCLINNKITPGYIVHHKIELTPQNISDPNISLSHKNLCYLCHDCHNKEHFGEAESIREGLIFDEYGDVITSE